MLRHFEYHNHLCLVFELLSIDVFTLLSQLNFEGLSLRLVRLYTKQILDCLAFLDTLQPKVIHCDLKPENILLIRSNNRDRIKVIDFGSSCLENERIFTYIQSRYYRSPEVILGNPYTNAIDMWSLGCIMMELLSGVPLFSGDHESQTIYQISTCLGTPSMRFLADSQHTHKYFIATMGAYEPRVPGKCPPSKPLPALIEECFQSWVSRDDIDSLTDFLRKVLTCDPRNRLTPAQALAHPFLEGVL